MSPSTRVHPPLARLAVMSAGLIASLALVGAFFHGEPLAMWLAVVATQAPVPTAVARCRLQKERRPRPRGRATFDVAAINGAAGLLLPKQAAARYREEWHGELYDLRMSGASWWSRASFIVAILGRTVPTLAVVLRQGRPRTGKLSHRHPAHNPITAEG